MSAGVTFLSLARQGVFQCGSDFGPVWPQRRQPWLTLKGCIPIIVDGGVYRGQGVFRALAPGASVVASGPVLWVCTGGSKVCIST
jgi:hypothetical protein